MTLTRWQRPEFPSWTSFEGLSNLRDEIDRFFESPLTALSRSTQFLNGWLPAVDVYEDRDNLVVKAELAGMKKDEIDISLHEGALTISGERKAEQEHKSAESYRSERYLGRFHRTVTLPTPVSADKVTANYADGILTITLPKTEEAKPKHIEVSVK